MTTAGIQDLPTHDTDVLVVGAGPTGLMAGLVLARRGVPAIVIDGKTGPTRESRALAVQARTMEIYDQLGLAEQVIAGGYAALNLQVGENADPVGFSIESVQEGDTPYPGLQIFEQSRNEELLAGSLESEGAPVRWRHRLVALLSGTDADDAGVRALVEGPDGLEVIRARWCIGADGAGSSVRHAMGAAFDGVTDDATFYVADLLGVEGLPDHSLAARFGRASFALFFPLGPGGHARIISMAPGPEAEQAVALEHAREDLGITFSEVQWFSAYRVHHRVASTFRKGSVILAGDAGHVHSPVGGQGMNTGLQDAHHLANLLADVAAGHRDISALDEYERDRRRVALFLVQVTDRAFSVIAGQGRGTAMLRRGASGLVASLAPKVLRTGLGGRLGGLLGQYRIHYHLAPSGRRAPAWAEDDLVGRRLPPAGSNLDALRSFTWQLHSYGATVARPDVPSWVEGPADHGVDPSGRLRSDRLYLVRPDGFVAASIPLDDGVADGAALDDALAAASVLR